MKKTKWIWRVLGALLLVVVIAGVGFAGFQLGRMQAGSPTVGMNFHAFGNMPKFQNDPHGFNNHGFSPMMNHRDNFGRSWGMMGFPFFFHPLFGLLEIAVAIGLIWLIFSLVKSSGWRLVNINVSQSPTPAPAEPKAEEEKKDEG